MKDGELSDKITERYSLYTRRIIDMVKVVMATRGLSGADLAGILGVSQQRVSDLLNIKDGMLSLRTVASLSVALEVDLLSLPDKDDAFIIRYSGEPATLSLQSRRNDQ